MAVKDNIAQYMTSLGERQYTAFDVSIIQRAIDHEFKDRKKNKINIKFRTAAGRQDIKTRIAQFANEMVNANRFSVRDIALYRACKEEEYYTRNNKIPWWEQGSSC